MIEVNDCWMKERCPKFNRCPEFCMKLFKLSELYDKALISLKQRQHINLRVDADGTDSDKFVQLKNITNDIDTFVDNGKTLYIHSRNTGNGKTSWALRFVESYFESIWWKSDLTCKALYISVPRYILALKASISKPDEYINYIHENIFKADLVILDEIGIKAATTFEMEHLLDFVNHRIELGKSTIYTSNLTDNELQERLGDRLYSRIANSTYNIEFLGQDKRYLK